MDRWNYRTVVWGLIRVVKVRAGSSGDIVVGVSRKLFSVAELLIMRCGGTGGWLAGVCLI